MRQIPNFIFQAKIRRAYNWYRSMTLGEKREPCKWDQLAIREGFAKIIGAVYHDRIELCLVIEAYVFLEPYSFDRKLPKFWNYAIASTLGHEVGHGFDVGGTYTDATGIFVIKTRYNPT